MPRVTSVQRSGRMDSPTSWYSRSSTVTGDTQYPRTFVERLVEVMETLDDRGNTFVPRVETSLALMKLAELPVLIRALTWCPLTFAFTVADAWVAVAEIDAASVGEKYRWRGSSGLDSHSCCTADAFVASDL